jgi:ParB-like chromosome segregation protein Spo0J
MRVTVPELIPIEQIRISPLRPPLSKIPYLKPSSTEIETAQTTGLIPSLIVKEIRRLPYPLYHILTGEKYWFIAQAIAGVPSLTCEVVTDKISEKDERKIITDNLSSYQININTQKSNPIIEAQLLKEKLKSYSSRYQYCKEMKQNQGSLSHKLNLLKLSIEVQALIKDAKFKVSHARFLYKIKNEDHQIKIALFIIENKLSAVQAWDLCDKLSGKKTKSNDSDLALVERLTSERLGYPVKISLNKKGSGEIKITFFDSNGADYILKKLGYHGDDF